MIDLLLRVLHKQSRNKYVQKTAIVLLAVLIIIFFIQMMGKALRPNGYDFTSYSLSAQALLNGTDPYHTTSVFPYIYPLSLAFFMIPIAVLPYGIACGIWFLLCVLALVFSGRVILSMVEKYGDKIDKNTLPIAILIFVLLTFSPIQNNLLNGQVDIIILYLCIMFFYCLSHKRQMLAAVFLALAVSIKIVPLFLLVFLLFKKEFKVMMMTLGFSVVFMFLPIVLVGDKIYEYYSYYLNDFVLKSLASQYSEKVYFNLSDALHRAIDMDVSLARIISFSLVLLFVVVMELTDRDNRENIGDMWKFSIYLMLILFLSPKSQKHYLVYMFPAIILGMIAFADHRVTWRPVDGWLFLLTFVFMDVIAKIDKHGPYFFVAICLLLIFSTRQLYIVHNALNWNQTNT